MIYNYILNGLRGGSLLDGNITLDKLKGYLQEILIYVGQFAYEDVIFITLQETDAMNKKMQIMKQRKLTLLAEVRYIIVTKTY